MQLLQILSMNEKDIKDSEIKSYSENLQWSICLQVYMPIHCGTEEPDLSEGLLAQDIFRITAKLHECLVLIHMPCGCSDCGNL